MNLNAFYLGISNKWIPPKLLLIMKMIIIIMTTCLLHVNAAGFGQHITLNRKNISLKEVLKQIRIQTGYDFIFDAELLNRARTVDVNLKNTSLEDALNQCLSGQNLSFEIYDKSVTIKRKTMLNNLIDYWNAVDVKGKVVDENGNPLLGAVVKVNGTNKQTSTNSKGEFSLNNVDEEAVLTISFVGYQSQEIKIKAKQGVLSIKMQLADNKMDEVVITTGIFKKVDKSFTGASTTVTAKELQQFGNRDLITSLRNIDPSFNIIESNLMGSNPNRLPDIQIRGNSSLPNVNNLDDFVGLNTPLVILDGFQSSLQKMLDINENEVESITILKDASATAIYGSRGSNGVIVITTKLPKPGTLRVSYRGDLNIEAADLSGYNVLDASRKLELERITGLYNHQDPERDYFLKRYYNFIRNEVNSGVNTDWLSKPIRTGIGQRHNFSLSGGVERFRYSASAQVNNKIGVMKGSERKTFNGTINLAYTYNAIKFSNRLMVTEGRSEESPYGSFSDYVRMNPYWRAYDDNGNALKIMGDPGNSDYSFFWTSLPTSPLYNATLNMFDKTKNSELINNSSVEWTVMKDFVVRAQLGLSKNISQTDKFRPAAHTVFANYSAADVFRKGDYNYGIGNSFNYDGSLNLQYSKLFNDKHNLFMGLDYNLRQNRNSQYAFLAEGFTNPEFDFISMGLQYAKGQKPSGNESLSRAMGITGNINYIYDDRYFADLSLRLDGSSQFGANKKLAPFWSAGLGWNMHNEAFLKENKIVNRLKLRGSVGITGSQNFNTYQALSTYRYYTDERYFNWMGSYLLGIGNEDLKWQQALKYDLGVDAEFLNGRLKVTGDYYLSTTKDLVSSVNLPASTGFANYIENIGKMRNRGFEFKATGVILNQYAKGWYWSITGALVHNQNKILKTSQALKDAQKGRFEDTGEALAQLYIEGYSTNTIWVVPSLGIDPSNGKEMYLDINGNSTYIWSGKNLRAMGNSDPDLFGNFSTMIRYKNIALNAAFGYRFGGQLYNQTLISKVENANYKFNVDSRVYDSRWQRPGDQAAFKGLNVSAATSRSSRFVQNENTIVCQNINIQYEVKSDYVNKKLGLSNLSFTANMADPFRFSSIQQERGTVYPFSRQFSLSMNATF